MSETSSAQPASTPRLAATVKIVAASISTASAPAAIHSGYAIVSVIEEVCGHDGPTVAAATTTARLPSSASVSVPGAATLASALVPAERTAGAIVGDRLRSTTSSCPSSSSGTRPPQVPTRSSRRAPSSISSVATIAALGPPMPVLWMLSGSAVGRRSPCNPTGRGCG